MLVRFYVDLLAGLQKLSGEGSSPQKPLLQNESVDPKLLTNAG